MKGTPPNPTYLYKLKCSIAATLIKAYNFKNNNNNFINRRTKNMKMENGLKT